MIARITLLLALFSATTAIAGADQSAPQLLATGHVDQAISALDGRISASPNDASAHNLLCRAYFTLGDWDRGIANCEKAVALAPSNSIFHLWLGRIYGEKADKAGFLTAAGLAHRVKDEFETAVRLDPGSVDARMDLAEFYLEAPGIIGGGRDKAIQQADSLRSVDPAGAYWIEARVAEKRKDYDTAEQDYRKMIEVKHGSASSWLNLALFYRHRRDVDEMEKAALHVRSAPLDRPSALVDAAAILLQAHRNLPEVVQLLRKYLSSTDQVEEAPAFKAHYLLGSAIEQMGDKQGALAEYRAALDLAHEFQPAQQALERLSR